MKHCTFAVDDGTPKILVSALKSWHPELSWSKVRKLLSSRRVMIGEALCIDEARKLRVGESVVVFSESRPAPPKADQVKIRFVDRHVVVVEKPARMVTLRHHKEQKWLRSRKEKQPALEEVIPELIYSESREEWPPLFSVHRIDRDTSGLLVFARTEEAQSTLIEQFANHDVERVYHAVVSGTPQPQTLKSNLVRDRGDGLRGSTPRVSDGKIAITHIQTIATHRTNPENVFTEVECRLETGRTHQIRIHLAELGHPVCGDQKYRGAFGSVQVKETSNAPRLALHACFLGFRHPETGESMEFRSSWPRDLKQFLKNISGTEKASKNDESGR